MRKSFSAFIFLLLLSFIPTTQAANFTVLTASDLITAITTANSNGQDDVITFADNISLTGTDNVTDGNNGLPSILPDGGHSLTIEGSGQTLAGNNTDFRLLHLASGADLTLNNITLRNGRIYNSYGGAIYSQGTLTITNSTISVNMLISNIGGDFLGGAIYATGTSLSVSNSTFTSNNVTDSGGVIRAFGGAIGAENLGTLEIKGSGFASNSVVASTLASGGAIAIGSNVGTSLLENNFFANNNVSSAVNTQGGAIGVYSDNVTVRNNTFHSNNATGGASSGGAVMLAGGSNQSFINNTFVGNYVSGSSLSGAAIASNVADSSRISTNNLFVSNSGASECANMATGTNNASDGTCAGTVAVSPVFGTDIASSLANNGGNNLTYALLAGSVALDAASAADCPATDQRGFTRPEDGDNNGSSICDIGAFELVDSKAYFSAISSSVLESGGVHTIEITVIIAQSLSSQYILLVSDAGTGNASAGSDYTAFAPQIISFSAGTPAGTYTRTVDITILDDSLVEGAELLDLTLTNAAGGITGSPSTHAVAIIDDDQTVFASAALLDINQVITEANTTVNVTVQLTVPVGFSNTGDVTVEVIDAASGNAVSGTDYTAFPATTVTFTGPLTAGSTYTNTVAVDILDDGTIEGAEALALMINQVSSNAEIGQADTHTLVINDNDANTYAQAAFVGNSALINENAGTLSIDVQVTIPAGFNLTGDISLTISDGLAGNATSGADYTAFAPVTLTFVDAPFVVGTTYTQTITLDILDDAIIEGAETVELAITGISGPVALVSPASFTAIINDDELTTRIITRDGETITVTNSGGTADTDFVFKTVDNPFATVGQTVIYTIRARNPKTIPLTQVVIYDVFDERLTDIQLLSTSHGAGIFNANTLTVSGFTLQPNEEALIVVSARIASLRAGETIPNAAILESPNASVHVSNLALVGDNPVGNSGGAAQVFIVPSQLPSTGESPLWRYGLIVGLGILLFLGVGGSLLHKRKG